MKWTAGVLTILLIVFLAVPVGILTMGALVAAPAVAYQIELDPCSAYTHGDTTAAALLADFELPKPGTPRAQSLHSPAQTIPARIKSLYVAAAAKYKVAWQLLAGIGMAETRHGRNNRTSSAGAQGLMQFMPGTFSMYGVDGDGDGRRDIHNDADSIFSAARYLVASGVRTGAAGVIKALWAYNRSISYRNDVLFYAWAYAGQGRIVQAGEGLEDCIPLEGGPIPGFPDDCPPSGSAAERGLKPAAKYGLRCVKAAFPQITSMGGVGSRPIGTSDHPRGLAVDFMIPKWSTAGGNAFGWRVARWVQANAKRLHVTYIIWDVQKWNPSVSSAWRPYRHPLGNSNPTLAHRDHVHVSFLG